MKNLVVFNWKMNPESVREAEKLFRTVKKEFSGKESKAVVAPPDVFLEKLAREKARVDLAGQDASMDRAGPYTGEVSPTMLKKLGAKYVILGHSERWAMGEDGELIAKKVLAAAEAGLRVILCVGEKNQVPAGIAIDMVALQLAEGLKELRKQKKLKPVIYVAYEPVWAISTTKRAKEPEDSRVEAVAAQIKKLGYLVLYGGSVNSNNIERYLGLPAIGGVLVGGASLKPEEIKNIAIKLK